MEYYDTSKDPRVLFVESVLGYVLNTLKGKKIQHVRHDNIIKILSDMLEIAKKIKWSYVSPQDIEKQGLLDNLGIELDNFKNIVWPVLDKQSDQIRKLIRFFVKTIHTFRDRFVGQKLDIENVVATSFVRVISVDKHPNAKNLYLVWVSDGEETYEIVTNDPTLRRGDVVPLAFLPPKEFMGITSEGMFIGGQSGIRRVDECFIGKQPELDEDEKNNLKAAVISAINILKK